MVKGIEPTPAFDKVVTQLAGDVLFHFLDVLVLELDELWSLTMKIIETKLAGVLILAIMITPTVTAICREVFASVSPVLREAYTPLIPCLISSF